MRKPDSALAKQILAAVNEDWSPEAREAAAKSRTVGSRAHKLNSKLTQAYDPFHKKKTGVIPKKLERPVSESRFSQPREGIDRESAEQFGKRVSIEIGKQLNTLNAKVSKLKDHWKKYDTSLRSGSWVNSGDLSRIRETLDSMVADLEWVD